MNRPDPIGWTPETMTKTEHRDEALRLMGRARRPQRPGEPPHNRAEVTHYLLSAQLHLALSTDPLTPDTREDPDPDPAVIHEDELHLIPRHADAAWSTPDAMSITWNPERQQFRITDATGEFIAHWDPDKLHQAIPPSQYPLYRVDPPRNPKDLEPAQYMAGWMDCMTMRLLHDRIPGFAITRPRIENPFEVNKEVLAQYGITTREQMYNVARYPDSDPRAHPRRAGQ